MLKLPHLQKDIMYISPDIQNLKAIKVTKEAVKDSSCTKFLIGTDEFDYEQATNMKLEGAMA